MLTPKEERLLSLLNSKVWSLSLWALAISVPFNIATGVIRLRICSTWAGMEFKDIGDVWAGLFSGVDPYRTYTGIHLLCEQQLLEGLAHFSLAAFMALGFYGLYQQKRVLVPLLKRQQTSGA